MRAINHLLVAKNPSGVGTVVVNGILFKWEEPSGWTGEIYGVINPAEIMGVSVVDIDSVMGVP